MKSLENEFDKFKDEIVKYTCEIIKIPSVYEVSEDKNKPFGENVNKALEYMLSLGKKLGFRTKNINGYCGYIEFGEGEEMVGIIVHLDVVPAGEGWTYPPFSATIVENKIYGRGAIDDKGPVISTLYAMKYIKDTKKVKKRVRLILGLNEEKDWKCINYYKSKEEPPTIGFSPDSDFPCIYAEKAVLTLNLKYNYEKKGNIIIKKVDTKNNPINVVPKYCSVELEINQIDKTEFIEKINEVIKKNKIDAHVENKENRTLKIVSHGISAHAAHPELGDNAINKMLNILYKIFSEYNEKLEILELFNKYILNDYDGEKMKINCEDESGNLTINLGNFSINENTINLGFNLRIPISMRVENIEKRFLDIANEYDVNLEVKGKNNALYVNKESYLVRTLCNVFNKVTNSNANPIAIGGATYARAFKNCVSFGPNMPGHKDMCHQIDEYIEIDNLILLSKIYAEAIEILDMY